MAIAASVEWEVRTTGVDANGGGFDPVSGTPGTDFSQQDAAQIAFTDLVIDPTTNTNCTSVANPFTGAHVGNILNITGGTGFTVQRVQIMSVAAGIATCDKSLGTLSSISGTGNLGGGLKTIGGMGLVFAAVGVAGNKIWIKYHASNVYSSTSATSNIVNGRLSIAAGTQVLPVVVRGYDTTHGDNTGFRPIIKWGVNAGSTALFSFSNVGNYLINVMVDGNRANFTSTRGVSLTQAQQAVINCKIMGCSAVGVNCSGTTSAASLIGCELTDCTSSAVVSISSTMTVLIYGCYFHDNQISNISSTSTGVVTVTRCIFDTNTTAGAGITFTSTGKLQCSECDFYTMFAFAIDLQAATGEASIANCLFESNGGAYAINTGAASVYGSVYLFNNGFYNNTGTYDTAKIPAGNVFVSIIQSAGTFFTDAANGDFKPNATAGQGALARAASYPNTFPGGTSSFQDVGAQQHQDAGGGGLAVPVARAI